MSKRVLSMMVIILSLLSFCLLPALAGAETKLLPVDGANYDEFGTSVAISGDIAVVGANGDDDNGSYSGSAYIFERVEGVWLEVAKLLPSDGTADDNFGSSVAISGDSAVVGAHYDDDNGSDSGSAYIFERVEGVWVEVAKLLPSDGTADDNFGSSVAISGDSAVVGAHYDDDNGSYSGSAYIFERVEGVWLETAKLLPADGVGNYYFGWSVAISDDSAVVGAWSSAYIFERVGDAWVEAAKLLPDDGASNFGCSVAISGDIAVVGAYGDDDNGSSSGSAYIFERVEGVWVETTKLLPADGAGYDNFGSSVAISGDSAVVGAHYDDDNGSDSGSAYIFERVKGVWVETAKLLPADGASGEAFGCSVAISGDSAVVGAKHDDDNGSSSGSAYIYEGLEGFLPPGITGIVYDAATGEPLAGVHVQIEDTEIFTETSSLGAYLFSNLDVDYYDLTFSYPDYHAVTISNVDVTSEDNFVHLSPEMYPEGFLNITTTELQAAETGETYNDRVRLTGGVPPYGYAIFYGSLPPGLSLDETTGMISGTPSTVGSYTFFIDAWDSGSSAAGFEFTIEVTEPLEFITPALLPRGTRNADYFQVLMATGGTQPYSTIEIYPQVFPTWLTLDDNGTLHGTPTKTGTYGLPVVITDSSARQETELFVLPVDEPLVISTTRLNDGIIGQAYNKVMTAAGGYGTYIWQLYTGTLPIGLTLSASGTIAGTPMESTRRSIILAVTDEAQRISYQDFSLQTVPALTIKTTTLPTGLVESPFSEAIRCNGGVAPYHFSYAGQLPPGLNLDADSGIISGTPTTASLTNVGITVTDSSWPEIQETTQNLRVRISSMTTIITPAVLANGRVGEAITPVVLNAGGGPSPFTWAIVDGTLPTGLALDPLTGQLSGTPLEQGDFNFTIRVTDDDDVSAVKEFFWHISGELLIATNVIPNGAQNEFYSTSLAAKGGLKPYAWRLLSGTLPSGLSFNNETGTISGIPTTRQAYSFTIEVSDNDNPPQVTQRTYEMEIFDNLFISTPTLSNGHEDEAFTATIEARLGIPPYAWQLVAGSLPPGLVLTSSATTASIDGTSSVPGTYTFTLAVNDSGTPENRATREFTIEIYGELVITNAALNNAQRGQAYSDMVAVGGGVAPYRWQISAGTLPTGLNLNTFTGAITGITNLDEGSSSTFTVRVTDNGNPCQLVEREFTIQVISPLAIISTVPPAQYGEPYEYTLSGSGGISPLSWTMILVLDGALPDGITFDPATGTLAGTPTTCGEYLFIVRLTDSSPVPESLEAMLKLVVDCSSLPVIEDFEDETISGIHWYSYGDAFWNISNSNPFNGLQAAESPPMADNQASSLETSVLCNNGPVRFWHAIDSEMMADQMLFSIDGVVQGSWSGSYDYTRTTYFVTEGRHTFTWQYSKNGSVSIGEDMAWVDDIFLPLQPRTDSAIDFNGDNIHDVALFYPTNNKWYIYNQNSRTYGTSDCLPIPGDYNGDGETDLAVVDCSRPDGRAKLYLNGTGVFIYGLADWIPVPGDYDGDGTTDFAFYNPTTGKWYVRNQFATVYGAGGIPVPGDYNGDGITDIAVFYPSTNKWYIKNVGTYTYGIAGCIPVPADYDGDGAIDLAVIDTSRPDGRAKWYIRNQSVFIYGSVTDTIPVPGDYDGDGDADPCLFYQNLGKWYCRNVGICSYGNGDMIPLAGNLATRYAISQAEGGSAVW